MGWQGPRQGSVVAAGVLVLAAAGGATVSAACSANGAEPDKTVPAPVAPTASSGAREITVMLPGKVPLVFVRIPAGTFTMGSPGGERGRGTDETQHQVTLTRDYFIGKYEVTQAQWQAIMGSDPSYFSSAGDYPVEQVSWNDITGTDGFLARLNRHLAGTAQPGAGQMHLPTEAEWERAARGGTTTRFSYGDVLDCNDFCKPCAAHAQYTRWCGNNDLGRPNPVGSLKPNPYGLYDVHGNVFEWVEDRYGLYGSSAQTEPKGPSSGFDRVIRGGRSDSPAQYLRSAYRGVKSPGDTDAHTGLRLARSQ